MAAWLAPVRSAPSPCSPPVSAQPNNKNIKETLDVAVVLALVASGSIGGASAHTQQHRLLPFRRRLVYVYSTVLYTGVKSLVDLFIKLALQLALKLSMILLVRAGLSDRI
jgi:hypothetical protein